MPKPISVTELKERLLYNPKTGVFSYRYNVRRRVQDASAGRIHPDGYVRIGINYKQYLGHVLAWLYVSGQWPTGTIRHRDGNRSNNAASNLEMAVHVRLLPARS